MQTSSRADEPQDRRPLLVDPDGASELVGVISVAHFAEVLIEITDTLNRAVDPVELLQLITTRTAAMSHSRGAAVLLADPQGHLQLAATSTTTSTTSLESMTLTALLTPDHPGAPSGPSSPSGPTNPWLDAFHTGVPVINTDLTHAADRWPTVAPHAASAVAAGYRTLSAFPLHDHTHTIGVLTLLHADPDYLHPHDVSLLHTLTHITTISLLHHRPHHPDDDLATATQIHTALTTRITTEQAKGALAHTHGVSIETASDLITGYAHRTHQHPDQVAEAVLTNPDLIPAAEPPTLLTPAEVAALFRVDPKTITRWAKTGQLTAVRTLGGHRRYHHGEITRLLKEG